MKETTTQLARMMAYSMHRLWPARVGVAAAPKTLRRLGSPPTAAARTADPLSFARTSAGHEPCQSFCEGRGADLV